MTKKYIPTKYNRLWWVTEVDGNVQTRLYPRGNKKSAAAVCKRLNKK